MDAEVTGYNADTQQHLLVLADNTKREVVLNQFNHTWQSFDNAAQYEKCIGGYCSEVGEEYSHVNDAITNRRLEVKDQLLCIEMKGRNFICPINTTICCYVVYYSISCCYCCCYCYAGAGGGTAVGGGYCLCGLFALLFCVFIFFLASVISTAQPPNQGRQLKPSRISWSVSSKRLIPSGRLVT